MKRIVYLLLLATIPASAQTYFPMKKGAVLEYNYYKGKGKKELRDEWSNIRWTRLTVEELWGDSVANVVIENETLARMSADTTCVGIVDGLSYGDVVVKAGETSFDNVLWSFAPAYFARWGTEDEHYLVNPSAAAPYPRAMNVGDTLPDVRYHAIFYEQLTDEERLERQKRRDDPSENSIDSYFLRAGMTPPKRPLTYDVEQTAMITKRYVDGIESVETPAGTFECYRITYEIVGPSERLIGHPTYHFENGIPRASYEDDEPPVIIKYVDYISPEVGLVKREKMNFRGRKAEETMVLQSVK